MELPRITLDEDKDLGRNQKLKRNQSVAVPGLLSVEKAQNFLGDHLGGGVNNLSLMSPKSKLNTSSAKLMAGNNDATSQKSFDSNTRKVGSPVSPSYKASTSNVRSKFFNQPNLEDEEEQEEEEVKAVNVSRVSNAKTAPK